MKIYLKEYVLQSVVVRNYRIAEEIDNLMDRNPRPFINWHGEHRLEFMDTLDIMR